MVQIKTPFHRGNTNIPTKGTQITLNAFEYDEYIKCAKDPVYFIRNYVEIVQLGKGLVKFNLYPYQERMINTFHNNRFIISLNPRQSGKSTSVMAYLLHQALFNEQFTIAILADKGHLAREILARIKTAYEYLPMFLKQAVITWNKGDIEFANGSKIKTFSTGHRSVAGQSIDLLYLDEFAHVQNSQQDAFWAGSYPVISSSPTTKIIITSTPAGLNLFYEIWTKAEKKMNEFVPYRSYWWETPGRDDAWKKQTIGNIGEERFKIEFEAEFIGSTNTLITPSKLPLLEAATIIPVAKEGNLDIFEPPQKDHLYALTVDVSEGQSKDYSAFSVIDVSTLPYKQVAKYRDRKISPQMYPNIIYNVGMLYNEAFVLVEINSVGLMVAQSLYSDLGYENMIKVTSRSLNGAGQQMGNGPSAQLGVKQTQATKRIGCAYLKTLIETDKLVINDIDTVNELKSFVAIRDSFAAEEGRHDDMVMSLVVFAWLANQQSFKDIIESDYRQVLQDDNYNMRVEPPQYGGSSAVLHNPNDLYHLKWKETYGKYLQDEGIEVDDRGDIWFTVETDDWQYRL